MVRAHSYLTKCLRSLYKDDLDPWEDILPWALFAMRTAVNNIISSLAAPTTAPAVTARRLGSWTQGSM